MSTSKHRTPVGLSAREFFERNPGGAAMTAAQLATGIAYSTIHAVAHDKRPATKATAIALQTWSLKDVAREHGVYISAAKTLEVEEPSRDELLRAAGE